MADPTVGGYNVGVPALPGCFTQGETVEESLERAKDGIGTYLDGEMVETRHAAGVNADLIVEVVEVETAKVDGIGSTRIRGTRW